ncbi:MAG: TraR/DksA family transcriptional regulator [Chitinophagaceae bacterium]|nr:MAG: TraR/DksA family transcriptional regulator [Chitinophagaceae bacterium]
MASSKKAVKPAAKKVAPKKVAKPAAKKVVAKPVAKKAAQKVTKAIAAKKPAAKPVVKAVAKKPAPKPVAKKAVAKPTKPAAKKPMAKPVPKAAALPAKSKSSAKPVPQKAPAKPAAVAPKKPVAAAVPAPQVMTKKTEDKKAVTKPAAAPAKPVAKGPKATATNPKDIKIAAPKAVTIPKINTKTSRAYQPDFTKSVLDQPKNDPGAPIVRYSDSDLTEFRELIQRKLGAAKKELNYLQGLITRKDDMGGDETDNRYMTMEDGSLSMEREQLSQMASRQITFIDHLEKALMRIENKTYGICRVTGKLIDKARLRAVPHATLSIEAKMGQSR